MYVCVRLEVVWKKTVFILLTHRKMCLIDLFNMSAIEHMSEINGYFCTVAMETLSYTVMVAMSLIIILVGFCVHCAGYA